MSDHHFGRSYHNLPGGFRTRPASDGDSIAYVRPGNGMLRDIPVAERFMEIVCAAGGSARGPRLVAVVTTTWNLEVERTPLATAGPGRVYTPCRCGPKGHDLDIAKVEAALVRLRGRPRKGRRIDVDSLRPDIQLMDSVQPDVQPMP